MFPFKFPYTNFHELNLDWILETTQSNTDRIAANEIKIALIGGDDPLNTLHPVGSIYMSADSTSPASLFGGEWEQIEGRFLLGADSTYAAGSTGGEETHTLTINEMPAHAHPIYLNNESSTGEFWGPNSATAQGKLVANSTETSGGNHPHNNMPPYISVYMWKRVS